MSQEQHDRRIDYIELPVTDVGRAKRFYSEAFGWTFKDFGDDYSSFKDGRLAGGLRKEDHVVSGGPLVVLYTVKLEAMEEKIKTLGGVVVKETFEFPGGRRFHFADPEGNELAVWSDR